MTPPASPMWLLRSLVARLCAGCVLLFVASAACNGRPADEDETRKTPYRATIRRTTAGVPHIVADDLGSVAFGHAYAFAEDNVCLLAEEIVTVRGERAKHFGDVPYDLGNTSSESNVKSDAFYRMEFTKAVADRYRAAQPRELRDMVRGYAAGISRYVRELHDGLHVGRHARCRDEPWLREIDDEDLYLRYYKLNLIASGGHLIDAVAAAQPPPTGPAPSSRPGQVTPASREPAPEAAVPTAEELRRGLARVAPKLLAMRDGTIGSNMYAFGGDATGGGGVLLGNPHFPWYGGERLYQVHLTVPGSMDIEGAALYGTPVVLIGFTRDFAWSHTVSTAYRFTPYMLTLKEGDPFTYVNEEGVERKIQAHPIEVEVKRADGTVGTEVVTLYRSAYGPMVHFGHEMFAWTDRRAFTFRDANAENLRYLSQYLRWNTATSLAEFRQIHQELVAAPWVNTVAADREGNVYYGDVSVVPNVPDDMAAECAVPLLSAAVHTVAPGLPLLDAAKPGCEWRVDPEAPQPGTFAARHLPSLTRRDYVLNCNDSFWLSNPEAPLRGFAEIVGRVDYPQSFRSRLCHQQVQDRLAGTDGLVGRGINAENVKIMALGSRVYTAERFRDEVRDAFCKEGTMPFERDVLTGEESDPPAIVDVREACAALGAWDGRNDPDSRGSLVWDELWLRIAALESQNAKLWRTPFDTAHPLETPRDLRTDAPALAQVFAAAVRSVARSGLGFAAPRAAVSYTLGRDGERISVPGGLNVTGNFTIAESYGPLEPGVGRGPLRYGNSYMQVVAFTEHGVDASTFVTYSQSTDPASPHFDDFTRRYARKEWVRAPFTEAEIAADTKSALELVE
jgi:acyl-homoserine-lactone acylase